MGQVESWARRLYRTLKTGSRATLVTLLEIFGGLALLMGAFVTIVSIPLLLSMLGAMFTVNIKYGFSAVNTIGLTPDGPKFGPPGYEINLLYIAGLLASAVRVLSQSMHCEVPDGSAKGLNHNFSHRRPIVNRGLQ
jgi:hypothetical protein